MDRLVLNSKLTSLNDPGWDIGSYCEQNSLQFNPDGHPEFLWIDTETTGLNDGAEQRDHILEFGCVATTRSLEVVDVFHSFLWGHKWHLALTKVAMNVHHMHTHSHLLSELMETVDDPDQIGTITRDEVTHRFDKFAQANDFEYSSTPMFGNTVSFDRGLIKQDLPEILMWFHYRNVDVSSLKELIKRWNSPVYEIWEELQPPVLEKEHRALLDISWSIRELDFYRRNFLILEESP